MFKCWGRTFWFKSRKSCVLAVSSAIMLVHFITWGWMYTRKALESHLSNIMILLGEELMRKRAIPAPDHRDRCPSPCGSIPYPLLYQNSWQVRCISATTRLSVLSVCLPFPLPIWLTCVLFYALIPSPGCVFQRYPRRHLTMAWRQHWTLLTDTPDHERTHSYVGCAGFTICFWLCFLIGIGAPAPPTSSAMKWEDRETMANVRANMGMKRGILTLLVCCLGPI